ncbi:hypothetical protein C0991_011465, partial [Blastosporella zonata]
ELNAANIDRANRAEARANHAERQLEATQAPHIESANRAEARAKRAEQRMADEADAKTVELMLFEDTLSAKRQRANRAEARVAELEAALAGAGASGVPSSYALDFS